jgi:hypothetical protein
VHWIITHITGMSVIQPSKEEIRKAWESANRRVIIATNAFGLGINRPDMRSKSNDFLSVQNQCSGKPGSSLSSRVRSSNTVLDQQHRGI